MYDGNQKVPDPLGEIPRNRSVGYAVEEHSSLSHARDGQDRKSTGYKSVERQVLAMVL